MVEYILNIQEPHAWKHSAVGGKAHALAEMLQLGANVPKAFCVTVDAYRAFARQPGVEKAIQVTLEQLKSRGDAIHLEDVANTLRVTMLEVPVPKEVADQIQAAYAQLGNSQDGSEIPVAVRSSATAEDLPTASFAGQHDSFLFIRGSSDVVESVRKCWVSLWSARAIQYREKQGFKHESVFMAVLVQRMVNAEVAGVLFTANPITKDESQMMVNAVWGLGETLVSGDVIPDEWVISKGRGQVLSERIAEKEIMAVEVDGKVVRKEVPSSTRNRPSLSSEQLMSLKEIGIHLERHFGEPQDIEWAFENEQLYLLQSRPITTVKTPPGADSTEGRFRVSKGSWLSMFFLEWLQRPLSPLFSTYVLPVLSSATDLLIERRLGLRRPSPTWLVLDGYYFTRGDVLPTLSLLLLPVKGLQNVLRIPGEWEDQVIPHHVRRIEAVRDFDRTQATAFEILRHLEQLCEANAYCWAWIILTGAFAMIAQSIFECLYEWMMGKTGLAHTELLSGFPNKSVEADDALWQLSESARSQESVKTAILDLNPGEALRLLSTSQNTVSWYDRFCEWVSNYGHRVFDLDIIEETMQDDPSIALQGVRSYLENPSTSPVARQQQSIARREAAERDFRRHLTHKPFWAKWVLPRCLSIAKRYAALRESRPFYLHLGWPLMRKDALELGRRLASHQIIQDVNDVFFLTRDELTKLVPWLDKDFGPEQVPDDGLGSRVIERKREYERQQSFIPPAYINPNPLVRFIVTRFFSYSAVSRGPSQGYSGSPGSPGKVRGRACIITTQNDFRKFKRGQVLVAPYTTTAWTPLLSMAAGVVTERGGALSHAAIIAREYGIPAVVGVPGITTELSDGDEVEVDGSAGCILLTENR